MLLACCWQLSCRLCGTRRSAKLYKASVPSAEALCVSPFFSGGFTLLNLMKSLWRGDEGVTAIEYGLLAALIAVAIITAATLVGTNLAGMFTYIAGLLPQGGGA